MVSSIPPFTLQGLFWDVHMFHPPFTGFHRFLSPSGQFVFLFFAFFGANTGYLVVVLLTSALLRGFRFVNVDSFALQS